MTELENIAKEILILNRNTLLVNLRFLDAALSRFTFIPIKKSTMGTNGRFFLYNPRYIIINYKTEEAKMTRDYLHLVFHCVFQHMYGAVNLDRNLWNLCCDMAVENVISGLNVHPVATKREIQQKKELDKIKEDEKLITAEKLYNYFQTNDFSENKLELLRQLFVSDDHECWYWTEEEILAAGGQFQKSYGASLPNGNGYGAATGNGKGSNTVTGNSNGSNTAASSRTACASDWKDISNRMQMELENFVKNRGDDAGNLMQNLKEVNREKYDYASFLKKFAVNTEVMKTNDDEFDYIFYTYGLKLYDKMPLIEPLEYKDAKRIREFVIAIDTSGSVIGEEVQSFVQKTYNILKSTESFSSKINLHILQCDAKVQEHIKITSQEEFDQYIKTMSIKGLGGTDFRPVFQTVDELIENKEFTNLKGLIYFTDGYGIFPNKKPDYETAFVFVNDDNESVDVPPWAIKLVLKRTEL